MRDFRKVMEPNTASNIKVRPKNVVKDFVHVAGVLGVSHLCMFTKTARGPYIKLARFPRGPTITYDGQSYCSLSRACTKLFYLLSRPGFASVTTY